MTAIPLTRDISEADMRSLMETRKIARYSYDTHVANKHIWHGMDSAYEAKRALLWSDYVQASYAVTEAGT